MKYEEVYLHAYDSVGQATAEIARYIESYNARRPHSSLDKSTPDEFYFPTLPAIQQAAADRGLGSSGADAAAPVSRTDTSARLRRNPSASEIRHTSGRQAPSQAIRTETH